MQLHGIDEVCASSLRQWFVLDLDQIDIHHMEGFMLRKHEFCISHRLADRPCVSQHEIADCVPVLTQLMG